MRDRKQKLEPQILVWSLAFNQFTLGAPAGSMKAPDDTDRRFIKTHKPPHHDKVFEEVGDAKGNKGVIIFEPSLNKIYTL